ncbi:MAG: class I SAM-dependent methyltransferase [Pseudomonas sp.]|uniref:class I SAM-dependent methyltransferase n=1 Tax=Pseudomonas sp. TaxID=306 RepID=UPI003395BF3C
MSDAADPLTDLMDSWTRNASAWTSAVRSGAIKTRVVTDRAMVEAVLARQPQRVLDLGCGEGWLIRALAQQGIDGVGVDASSALIEAAQQAGGGTFYLGSYAELAAGLVPLGNSFNVICANFALLHAEIAPLLRALRPLLAAGGALIIQTLHPWAVGGAYRDGWREEDFASVEGAWQPMPWYFRTLESWVEVLHESGYAVRQLYEPRHPETGVPLSMLCVAEPPEQFH